MTVSHLKEGAKYAYGQVVRPIYSCIQPQDAARLPDCSAEDDLGNDVASGAALKTKLPGRHSLTVSATSDDGAVPTQTIDYTVLPNDQFVIAKVRSKRDGTLQFQVALRARARSRSSRSRATRRSACTGAASRAGAS